VRNVEFILTPNLFSEHTAGSEFAGPATFHLGGNRVLMFVTGGRPPVSTACRIEAKGNIIGVLLGEDG